MGLEKNNMAYKQEPGKKPSVFGEVLRSRGLLSTIANPKLAKKQASDIRIARLKEQEAAKPKNLNPTFFTMEAYKPEATAENPKPIRQYYKTERTAGGGTGDIVSRELDLDYSRKMYNVRAKAMDRKSAYWAMREDIRKSRPDYRGSDATKKQKLQWKDRKGKTGGKKNQIKNRYGFGFVPMSDTPAGGVEGSGNVSSSTGRSQGGVCTQAKALAGKCN